MRSAVVLFPGSNRDRDAIFALTKISGKQPLVWWHQDPDPPGPVDLVMIPGGFSYGDYLRTGAIAARAPAMNGVRKLAEKGVHVLGVCNGFQILTEAGLLPGALTRNAQLNFICRDLWLKVESADSPFTRAYSAGQVLRVPVAHHDGCYYADDAELDRLEGEGLVAFRYCAGDGAMDPGANLNGSRRAIAGVYAPGRRILGMMPHPENAVDPLLGSTDGAGLFQSLVETLS